MSALELLEQFCEEKDWSFKITKCRPPHGKAKNLPRRWEVLIMGERFQTSIGATLAEAVEHAITLRKKD